MRRSILAGGVLAIGLGIAGAALLYSWPQPDLPTGNPPRERPAGREIVLAIEGMH